MVNNLVRGVMNRRNLPRSQAVPIWTSCHQLASEVYASWCHEVHIANLSASSVSSIYVHV